MEEAKRKTIDFRGFLACLGILPRPLSSLPSLFRDRVKSVLQEYDGRLSENLDMNFNKPAAVVVIYGITYIHGSLSSTQTDSPFPPRL